MSDQPAIDASQALIDLIFMGLDHGIDSVRGGEPLTPFVVTVGGDGKRTLTRFATDRLEHSAARAQEFVAALGADISMYAIALDGYFTVDGEKFDAILVEGGERGKPFALQFAQRYRLETDEGPLEKIGNPAYLGQIEQRLRG
jgi:hypothetical protein